MLALVAGCLLVVPGLELACPSSPPQAHVRERVERGQEREQRVTTALVTRPVVLPRHPAPNVLEAGEQSSNRTAAAVGIEPFHCRLSASTTSASTTSLFGGLRAD
ncbi:MAG TPA: hypothetical protein VGD94_15755 [Vicinamibacterales bacterium]